jgi:hypothetical protein
MELSTWHNELPSSIQFEDNAREPSVSDNPASLDLGYHTLQLTIFRAILRSFRNEPSIMQDRDTLEWKEANAQCRAAAKNAVIAAHNFASSLSTKHFQPFWAPCKQCHSSKSGSISVLLQSGNPSPLMLV